MEGIWRCRRSGSDRPGARRCPLQIIPDFSIMVFNPDNGGFIQKCIRISCARLLLRSQRMNAPNTSRKTSRGAFIPGPSLAYGIRQLKISWKGCTIAASMHVDVHVEDARKVIPG
jgi:hypothetical protein